MEIKYHLFIYNSRADKFGNSYWAFSFVELATDKLVEGDCASGSDGNIRNITFGFSEPNEWDRSVLVTTEELPIRVFNKYIKGWEYAGDTTDKIRKFIKDKLAS